MSCNSERCRDRILCVEGWSRESGREGGGQGERLEQREGEAEQMHSVISFLCLNKNKMIFIRI